MTIQLRTLIVEDNIDDAELLVLQLAASGLQLDWTCVDTEESYLAALDPLPDLILSDWSLPSFSGLRALQLLTERGYDIPFLIVSGNIGEEAAIEALRCGASDYVLKDRPARLGEAVRRALDEQQLRAARARAEQALRESEDRFRRLMEQAPDLIYRYEFLPRRGFVYVSPAALAITGFSPEDHYADPDLGFKLVHPDDRPLLEAAARSAQAPGEPLLLRWVRKDGTVIWTEQRNVPILDAQGTMVALEGIARDVTARVRAEVARDESERLARATVDALSTHIAILDPSGTILAVNRAWRTFAAANGAADTVERVCEGINYLAVCAASSGSDAEDARAMHAGILAVIQGRQDSFTLEYPCHAPDEQRWFQAQVTRFAGKGAQRVVVAHENITERKRAEEVLRHELGELEALHTISAALRTAETRTEALTCLLDQVLAVVETDSGAIWVYDAEQGALHAAVNRGWFALIERTPLQPDVGVGGRVFATGACYYIRDFQHDALVREAIRAQLPAGWGGICIPIRVSSMEIVGVLYVAVPHPRLLSGEQVKLLEAVAEMGGVALHRMRLYEETVQQVEHLHALRRVDQAITATTDIRMALSVLTDQIMGQMPVDAVDVLLLNTSTQTLTYLIGRGFRTQRAQQAQIRLGAGFPGGAALSRQRVQIEQLQGHEADLMRSAGFQAEGFVAYVALPLIAKGQIKGVLEVFQRSPRGFGESWMSLLETFVGQAAIAIESAQLFEHLQRSNTDLALAYDATIEGWSRAMDLRDKETEGHTLRVTELTIQLAAAIGMESAEIVHVRRGALLHDIGKIGVPDAILLKPGPLTDEEWVVMRTHPQLAYDMLAPIRYLRPALDIPYCHHEKWDGTGYPRGLAGEQIPLAARIFAVVDVWDALRSDRPYRKGWSEERTLEYIRSLAGSHFAPRAVDLFLQLRAGAAGGQSSDVQSQ
jgi:PAS domain S-box-containing protein